jgi:hypothetical protein
MNPALPKKNTEINNRRKEGLGEPSYEAISAD